MGVVWRRENSVTWDTYEKGRREGWEGDKVGEKQYKQHLLEKESNSAYVNKTHSF